MRKRGQSSSFDFIVGIVIFISVLSVFLFYLSPRQLSSKEIPYSAVQSAWFALEKQGFIDNYLINESLLDEMNYSVLKSEILSSTGGSFNSDFCFYTVAGKDVFHFGPNSTSLNINAGVSCGSARAVSSAKTLCMGSFNSGRSISRPAYSVDTKKLVKMTLLVCAEVK